MKKQWLHAEYLERSQGKSGHCSIRNKLQIYCRLPWDNQERLTRMYLRKCHMTQTAVDIISVKAKVAHCVEKKTESIKAVCFCLCRPRKNKTALGFVIEWVNFLSKAKCPQDSMERLYKDKRRVTGLHTGMPDTKASLSVHGDSSSRRLTITL